MRNNSRATLLSMTALLLLSTAPAFAQKDAPKVDCSVDGRQLTCDRSELLKRFAEARTLALESQPQDHVADVQLASFAKKLTKQVVPAQPADITVRIVRNVQTGMDMVGSADVDLASLRIFSTKNGTESSHLLWVETYHGQQDMQWYAVVHALMAQFQQTLAGH
jgi:hypothetical protein